MSGRIRFGIIGASLCVTAALIWAAAGLATLLMHLIIEHPDAAKAMGLLPVFMLPVVAIVLQRRRRAATSI